MAILTSTAITEDDRRDTVREYAGISDSAYEDADLDRKIETADEIARTYFGAQGAALDGTEDFFANLVTVSNLLASIAIREGIGGSDNIAVVKEQSVRYRSIVSAQNRREPEQGIREAIKTRGINSGAGPFT